MEKLDMQKVWLTIWIIITIITIIPNIITLIKYFKGQITHIVKDTTLFSWLCLWMWSIIGIGVLISYIFPIIYNLL